MKKRTIVFLCILLISSLIVAGAGALIRNCLLLPLGIDREENLIALPFVLLTDEVLQGQVERKLELANNPPAPETTAPAETEPETTVPASEAPTQAPTEAPTEPQPVYTPVDESWFDDALFIGDSRTTGLQGLARLGKADYFCAGSMTIYGIRDALLSDLNFPAQNLKSLLESREYGKVYIHLGLNELVAGADAIMEEYEEVIRMIRETEPDAYIILMACMSISPEKGSGKNFPIAELHKLNDLLRQRAEQEPEMFRFCDVNSWAAGEDGYIRPEITCDGCHLYGLNYEEWAQWILEDAGWYNIP